MIAKAYVAHPALYGIRAFLDTMSMRCEAYNAETKRKTSVDNTKLQNARHDSMQ